MIYTVLPPLQKPQLRLVLTEKCNLSCSYCHSQTGHKNKHVMPIDVALSSLNTFILDLESRGHSSAEVSLYGGEPLLNKPVLEAVLQEIERARARGLSITSIINTNGTLITEELAAKFAEAEVRAHVSLDGPDEAANANRVDRAGRSSWPDVISGFNNLKNAGCDIQINSVVNEQNAGQMVSLIKFAQNIDCRQIFMALPDGEYDVSEDILVFYAHCLLEASSWAKRRNIEFFGPWAVGLREYRETDSWPPINIIVKAEGKAFFPHLPHRLFPSIKDALDPELSAHLEEEWIAVLEDCQSCKLLNKCQGYIKMMVRYHTGDQEKAGTECTLSRLVFDLAQNNERFLNIHTAMDLRLRAHDGDEIEVKNPLIPDSALLVSPDVLHILNWFLRKGTQAGLERSFSAENLGEAFNSLREKGLLLSPSQDTDLIAFSQLSDGGAVDVMSDYILGALQKKDLSRLIKMVPFFDRAREKLPDYLRSDHYRFCIFAVPDAAVMAKVLGSDANNTILKWMAGTILFSVLIINLELCDSILAHNGRIRLDLFERNLTHEFSHLSLRQSGIRLPLWLEEGVCEHLSGSLQDMDRLHAASTQIEEFGQFVKECHLSGKTGRGHETGILEFSEEPVDTNSGYILAYDFVSFLIRKVGFNEFLADIRTAGLNALLNPFPLLHSNHDLFKLSLEDILSAWRSDLDERLSSRPSFPGPIRAISHNNKTLIYNRIVGGYIILKNLSPENIECLRNHNCNLKEIEDILHGYKLDERVLKRWGKGVFAPRLGYHLRLALDDSCNMNCTYCYEIKKPSKPMSIDVADRAVTAWRNLLRPVDVCKSSIRFFGGEPFLNWDVMKHILDTADQGFPDDSISWIINTNGTLMKPEHIVYLQNKGEHMMVLLSCDGVGNKHDKSRVFKNGRGTFKIVDQAADLLARSTVPFSLAATIGDHNIDGLDELAYYAIRLRDKYQAPVSLSLTPPITQAMSSYLQNNLEQNLFHVIDICRREDLPVFGIMFHAFKMLLRPDGSSGHFCGISGTELSVDPSGNLLACHAIPGSIYGKLSDLDETGAIPFPDHLKNHHVGRIKGCEGCEVEGLCGGGCMAQAVWTTGEVDRKPGLVFCELIRKTFRKSIKDMLQDALIPEFLG